MSDTTPTPSKDAVQRGTAFTFTAEHSGSRYDLMVGKDEDNSWLIAVTNFGVSTRIGHLDDPGYLATKLGIARVDAAQIIACIINYLTPAPADDEDGNLAS